MTTRIGFSSDPAFLDDFLLKEGSIPQKFLDRIETESPHNWFDWDNTSGTLTLQSNNWIVHYNSPFPLCFYYGGEFAFGIRRPESEIYMDFESPDAVWARVKRLEDPLKIEDEIYGEGSGRIVMERGDFPRFQTQGRVHFSHTLRETEIENVYSLGNGYVLASSLKVDLLEYGAKSTRECWWMIAPESEAMEASRRVLAVKLYDGPHVFQSRHTDIRLADPIPPSDISEYVIYSYDREGIKGIYREIFQGIMPQKKAFVLQGEDLLSYANHTNLRYRDQQLTGSGRARYRFPLYATKFLNIYWRGSEVEAMIRADDGDWVALEDYDGKAVTTLDVEFTIYTSLASIRVEYESLKDWVPVGRPVIDIIPISHEGERGNALRIKGHEGEGLRQSVELYTGIYSASADVSVDAGEAVLDIGGIEVVSWSINKNQRASGDFIANNDEYDITITGNGDFLFEIDRVAIMETGHHKWSKDEVEWYVETEDGKHDATHSINNPETPVSLGEEKYWRIGIKAPEDIENHEVDISSIYTTTYSTGRNHITKNIRWKGEGSSRLYYPENVISAPVNQEYISLDGAGAVVWQQDNHSSEGDVHLTIDGSPLSYADEFIYRPVKLENALWEIFIEETEATIYYQGNNIGRMSGQGLPFRVSQLNSEDIHLDCSIGFVQLRRGMGPRFEGWDLSHHDVPVSKDGAMTVWGATTEESDDNLNFYRVFMD